MKIDQNKVFKGLSYLILIELVLGGSGRVISLGPLTLRMILFGIVLICEFILLIEKKLYISKKDLPLLLIIFYFLLNSCISSFYNNTSDIFDVLLGYMTILICPFFIYLCKTNEGIYRTYYKLFLASSFVLAVMSIGFWFYSYIMGKAIYYSFMVRLNSQAYSRMGFIGNIPRIFLKGSIFVCIGFLFSLHRLLHNNDNKRILNYSITFVYLLACIFTFTLGFYIGIVITSILVIGDAYKFKPGRVLLLLLVGIPLIGIVINYFDVVSILMGKFVGGYTSSARLTQLATVINDFLSFPAMLIGKGFGTNFYIDYGYEIVNHYNLEIMWLQLLADTGLIGFGLYFGYIIIVIRRMFVIYRYANTDEIYIFAIGLLLLCLISFINPFMNNAIGLTYFAVCVGLTNTVYISDGHYESMEMPYA
ncbi:MAG: hypothetical protein PHC91_02120 [Eubacteriales bacterium]|nr:hypothetical protein [Eubacteriales bacterium]